MQFGRFGSMSALLGFKSTLVLCVLSCTLSSGALAQGVPAPDLAAEAELHFSVGIEEYKKGQYQGALEHLLLSNRLVPNRSVVFNIARTYEVLGDFDAAYRSYDDYLALEQDADRREVGVRAMERIADRVALVRITSNPPGASIYVDRRDLGARGTTPRTLALSPGEHTILLEQAGHLGASEAVVATRGVTSELSLSQEAIRGTVRLAGSPAGATVRLGEGGEVIGTLPGELSLPPGPQLLVVEAPGFAVGRTLVEVVPDAGRDAVVDLALITGTVVVDALERDALIEVDGVAVGFTPAVLEVPIGERKLTVSLPGFRPYEQTMNVEDGGRVTIDARLRSLTEVTAASRATQAVEDAPASVSVITADEIRAFGYTSVYDALGAVRGVFQSNDLIYEYLGFRGFSRPGDYGNRMLLTLDGHTINDDQNGASYVGADFSSELADVKQIEVVRGPGSSLYGSNAFFGVVNVVTHDRKTIPEPQVVLTGAGVRTGRAKVAAGLGDEDLGGWASVGVVFGQGQDLVFDELADTPRRGRAIRADDEQAVSAQAKGWAGPVTIQAYHNARTKGIATGAYGTLLGDPTSTSNDARSFLELRAEPKLGEHAQLLGRAYVDRYEFYGSFPYTDGDFVDSWRGLWVGAEPRVQVAPAEWLNLTLGAEGKAFVSGSLQTRDPANQLVLDEQPTHQIASAYAVVEAKAGSLLSASVGGRYDYFTLGGVGGSFNPRLAVVMHPTQNDVIKVLAGTAFRAPSVFEFFYENGQSQVAPDFGSMGPERIRTAELEASHRFSDVLTATVSGYGSEIFDLVDLVVVNAADNVVSYANSDQALRSLGAEAELRHDWRRGMMLAVNHSIQATRVGDALQGELQTNSPGHLFGLRAAAPIVPGATTASTRLRVGSSRRSPNGISTPAVVLWDATVSGVLPSVPVSYSVGVRNLLDWKELHPASVDVRIDAYPMAGRTAFAQLTIGGEALRRRKAVRQASKPSVKDAPSAGELVLEGPAPGAPATPAPSSAP